MESKGWNENQISPYAINPRGVSQYGIMHPMVRENNKVKCVFWGEKYSIFALDMRCIKGGNTQTVHQIWHCGNGAIFKRD
jgi:hypothetical protein